MSETTAVINERALNAIKQVFDERDIKILACIGRMPSGKIAVLTGKTGTGFIKDILTEALNDIDHPGTQTETFIGPK